MPSAGRRWRLTIHLDLLTFHEVNDPNEEFALGLNKDGFIIFIILLCICLPVCWLPFVIDKYKVR